MEAAIYQRASTTNAVTALLAAADAIYNPEAPEDAANPFVIFSKQAGSDDNDNPHRARQLVYLIKGVVGDVQGTGASKTLKDAGAIDDALDAAFHKQLLTVTGWTNFWLVREQDIRYQEDAPGGRRYYHAGGLYRLRVAQ